MRLEGLVAKNFRLLENVELKLGRPVTVLIGPNNVGKSNIIDALLFLRDATSGFAGAVQRRHGFDRVVSGQRAPSTIHLALSWSGPDGIGTNYGVDFDPAGLSHEEAQTGSFRHEGRRNGQQFSWRAYPAHRNLGTMSVPLHNAQVLARRNDVPEIALVAEALTGIVHIEPFRDVSPQVPVGVQAMVNPKGDNLGTVIHYHYTNDREKFDAYEDAVCKVLPEIDILETPLLANTATTVSVRFRYDSTKYDLSEISSGIKGVLVLLAAAHFSPPDTLLLVEEPENHLHPAAQKALCSVIKDVAERDGKQFILSTHSDSVLRQFSPEDCFFVDRSESGLSSVTPLPEVAPYAVSERLGVEVALMLEMLGRARQVVVISEGRTDAKVLEALWREHDLSDSVLVIRANGGGWQDIVDSAADLQKALNRFRFSSDVFVVLDSDGKRGEKVAYLEERGLGDDSSHVWTEKEIESYLVMPSTLSNLSGKSIDDVQRVIEGAKGSGKTRLKWILDQLGADAAPSLIITNAVRQNPDEIHEELSAVTEKVRRLLSLRSTKDD